jgi:acyl-CoA thioester hydrolase
MDFNAHMRNTAFLDKCVDVRMMFFAENGFSMDELMRRRIGPVVMKDEVEYYKEVRLLDPLRVTLLLAGLAEDGSRFSLRNELWREDGKLLARVTSTGGWLDLASRKLIIPPEALLAAIRSLTPTEDFQVLASSIKANGA